MAETPTPDQRRKGTLWGLGIIAYGLIGAIVLYYQDSHSMNFFAQGYATQGAILHALLWGLFGLGVIAWNHRDRLDPPSPFDDRDNNRDGVRKAH